MVVFGLLELGVVAVLVVLEVVVASRTDVRRQRRDELRRNVARLRQALHAIEPQREYARFIRAERELLAAQEELDKVRAEEPAAWLSWWRLAAPAAVAAVAALAGRADKLAPHWPLGGLGAVWTLVLFVFSSFRVARLSLQGVLSAAGMHHERGAGPQ